MTRKNVFEVLLIPESADCLAKVHLSDLRRAVQ
jgi:hypothetical protein